MGKVHHHGGIAAELRVAVGDMHRLRHGCQSQHRGVRHANRCSLILLNRSRRRPRLEPTLVQRVLDAALAGARLSGCSLTVLLVDDDEATRLHDEHFHDPTTTDVMTFPDGAVDPESGRRHLGDLAVCVDVAAREARRRHRPMRDEVTLYILHGLLHLIGYDDTSPRRLARMWTEQRRLLARVGIALEEQPG